MKSKLPKKEGSRLGTGAEAIGRLEGAGPLELLGALRGEIEWEGAVVIASSGFVEANGRVARLEVLGSLKGDVTVTVDAYVGSEGSWTGRCTSPSLATDAGARLEGELHVVPAAPPPSQEVEEETPPAS